MKFKLRRYYLYYAGRALAFLVYMLPLAVGRVIGVWAGRIAYGVLPRYRRLTIEHLTRAFGTEKSPAEIRRLARRVFENLGRNGAELLNFPKIDAANIDERVTIKHRERLDAALAAGKGVLVITGHFGNWELLAMAVRLKGYGGTVIGRRIYFHKYDAFLNYLRKANDVNIIYRDSSPRAILKVLRQSGIVGILADQDVDSVEGVFVNFFGRPAYTPAGPVALARVSGAVLLPAYIVREGARHVLVFEEPIRLADTGDKAKDLITDTQKWSDVLESYIRRYPDHWVWMHRRWKTEPQ